jgi:8-oxo-dGTP pyrophosphatase MutT (NUDIX family)
MGEQKGQADGPGSLRVSGTDADVVSRGAAPPSSADSSALPIKRRLLHLWFRLSRGMTLGVRALVLDPAGRVFLVRHGYMTGWHFPGGGVEVGQSLHAALVMELAEEANIVLTMAPELFGVYHNHPVAPRDHVALFVVRDFTQTAPREPDFEIAETGFFALDALPAETTAGTRRRLDEVLGNAKPAECW